MLVHRISLALALAAGLTVLASGACAADAPAADKPKLKLNRVISAKLAEDAAKKDEAKKDDDKPADGKPADGEKKEEEEAKDPFAIPEGGVKELLAFVQETMKYRPKTQQEAIQFRVKGLKAMREACEKIQATATDEDKKLSGFADIAGLLLYFRAQEARTASAEDKDKLLADLKTYFANTEEPVPQAIQAASALASGTEYGPNPQEAIVIYKELGAVLAKSKNEKVAKQGAKMEGAARRLGLIGQPLELSGTEMDGSKFDWEKLRGKVVLVDFWATWCGPCRAELPNVKKNYEAYHDKGFEVVGISLDRDRKALESFLEKEQNPWITLHDGDWADNSVATYYGVMGIPTVILVDKEGKVVSTRARGPELGKLLADLLGPVEEKPAEEKPAEEKPADKAAKDEAAKTN